MAKRALLLIYESMVRDFDAAELIRRGWEVYCPRICGNRLGESFLSLTDQYDKTLSIDKNALANLNRTDFYSEPLSEEAATLINNLFDLAVVTVEGYGPENMVKRFKGQIILRFLGNEEGKSCTETLVSNYGFPFLSMVRGCKERFWVAFPYKNMIQEECDFIRGRSLMMPVYIPVKETEKAARGKPVLLCSNIQTNQETKKFFMALPPKLKKKIIIAGDQLIKLENDDVTEPDSENYDKVLKEASSAFFPLKESTQFCSSYLDALVRGTPVLYFKGSTLHRFLGFGKKAVGCVDSLEAGLKLAEKLTEKKAEKMASAQRKALITTNQEKAKKAWDAVIDTIEKAKRLQNIFTLRKKRICLFVTKDMRESEVSFVRSFVFMFKRGIEQKQMQAEIIFAYENNKYLRGLLEEFHKEKIVLRECSMTSCDSAYYKDILAMAGYISPKMRLYPLYGECAFVNDGINNLLDCDYLIQLTPSREKFNLHFIPYAMVIASYDWRVSRPERDMGVLAEARLADEILCTDMSLAEDSISYGLLDRNRICTLPFLFETKNAEPPECEWPEDPYFTWMIDSDPIRGRHRNGLAALFKYYENEGKMNCQILLSMEDGEKEYEGNRLIKNEDLEEEDTSSKTGDVKALPGSDKNTEENESLAEYLKKEIKKHVSSRKKIKIVKVDNRRQMLQKIRGSAFVYHPGVAERGQDIVYDAATMGVPSLCQEDKTLQCIEKEYGLSLWYTNIDKPETAASDLLQMQKLADQRSETLKKTGDSCALDRKETEKQLFAKVAWITALEQEVRI